MPDKFVIRKQPKEAQFRPVMLSETVYGTLVQLKEMSGASIQAIAESAIRFALDRVEIKEEGVE